MGRKRWERDSPSNARRYKFNMRHMSCKEHKQLDDCAPCTCGLRQDPIWEYDLCGSSGPTVNNPKFVGLEILEMSCSNINEPFVLATYYSTLRGNLNPRFGAFASVHQRSDEYVTVAAQADGVHILDVRIILCSLKIFYNGLGCESTSCDLSYIRTTRDSRPFKYRGCHDFESRRSWDHIQLHSQYSRHACPLFLAISKKRNSWRLAEGGNHDPHRFRGHGHDPPSHFGHWRSKLSIAATRAEHWIVERGISLS